MLTRLRSVDETIVARLASTLKLRLPTARCLAVRGVTEPSAAQGFIDPRLAALRPPAGLAGLSTAVGRLATAVERGERIGVFGDYDVDGITTAALLTTFLRACGVHVEVAVASRHAGYGFTAAAADDFADRGCTLVITGDCGTSDLVAISRAAQRGIEVIVVDHHTVPAGDSHPSCALVNPHRADSTFPFRGMASVGLGFYVAAAVRTELRDRGFFRTHGPGPEPDVRELLDFVALGTIADLVPLAAENRILTSLGLKRMNATLRPGVAALLQVAGVDREVDARTVSWKLAPRINAPGRLGAAEPALMLLLADESTAAERAQVLEAANAERREVQDRVMTEAMAMLESVDTDAASAIVVAGEGWPPGVVGIVAAKLVDKFQRPAFVVAIDADTGIGRGSARSCNGVNLYDALAKASGCLDRFGGHAAAAGFTLTRERVAALDAELRAACAADGTASIRLAEGSGRIGTRDIDAEVRLAEVDERLAEELAGLGPFGQENPPPVLVARHTKVTALRRVGDGSHLKLTLEDGFTSRTAIGFGLGPREVEVGSHIDVAFLPTISTWQGRRSAELELADLAVSRG